MQIDVSSHHSSARSSVAQMESWCSSLFTYLVRSIGTPILLRMTASMLNASKKRVSPVGHCCVVLYIHKTPGSYSTHFLFVFLSRFFKLFRMVLLVALPGCCFMGIKVWSKDF